MLDENVLYFLESTVTYNHCYRPQHSCRKVMFSQAFVILSTGGVYPSMHWAGGVADPPGMTPPWADTPHQTSPHQTPRWADTPCPVHAGIHTPPAQYLLEYTPPAQWMLGYTQAHPVHAGIHLHCPPPRRPLQQTVPILLECILVVVLLLRVFAIEPLLGGHLFPRKAFNLKVQERRFTQDVYV